MKKRKRTFAESWRNPEITRNETERNKIRKRDSEYTRWLKKGILHHDWVEGAEYKCTVLVDSQTHRILESLQHRDGRW